jgi:NRAMP (natural resistance-associated macrophage protein)-like metal ion transporter
LKFMRKIGRWRMSVLLLFAALGPGFITANADNDAGGIYTYTLAGARYGYSLLWTLIPMAIALSVAQEMCARMAVVTGKGLSGLIREQYGLRVAFLLMTAVVLLDFGNIVAEFAGIGSGTELFGVNKYLSVPVAAALVWLLVVYGSYKWTERVFLFASFLYVAYIATAVVAKPDWYSALASTVHPPVLSHWPEKAYLYMAVGIIGATVAPWQQFYLQASVVDKGLDRRALRLSQFDAIVGSVFSVIIAGFIIIAAAATLFAQGHHDVSTAADAAQALEPLAGKYAFGLFAIGLVNASLFAATILPLSTAYTVCEALGLESGLDRKFKEAPGFYWLYTLLLGGGALLVLFPKFPFVAVAVLSQVLNGVEIPFVLIFMLLLASNRELMGDYVNSRRYNVIAWIVAGGMILFALAMLFAT